MRQYIFVGGETCKMDRQQDLEERFREMCCIGNIDKARMLVERGVKVNAVNQVNGWTALHWAAKRAHENIVEFLIREGADVTKKTVKGEFASSLTTNAKIREMLGGLREESNTPADSALPIVPNYLRNPDFFYAQKSEFPPEQGPPRIGNESNCKSGPDLHPRDEELVLKLRVAGSEDPDFIEVELPTSQLTYQNLLNVCCEELDIKAGHMKKIRKLPNTMLRKDKDVMRLQPFQELEIVLNENGVSQI